MRAILMYHSIDPSGSPISLDDSTFARHVQWLASGAVRVVSLSEITSVPHDENALAVTFDDGYSNFGAEAWPRLRDAGVPATVFVVPGHVGEDNRWGGRSERGIPDLPLLDWDGLATAVGEGAELGGHGVTHPSLPRLDDASLERELVGCRDQIEQRTGVRPTAFCYPYGDHDDRVVARTRQTYDTACTVALRPLTPRDDPCRLPRLDAYYLRAPGQLEAFGTRAFGRRMAWRSLLRGVRSRARRLVTPGRE